MVLLVDTMHAPMSNENDTKVSSLAALSLAALGIVYGDIGTSPLYALKSVFTGASSVAISADNVLGVLSLVFWSLVVVVSIKYIALILRADNRGEGGIVALMSLVLENGAKGRMARAVVVLGLFGAALFYGDSAITPAISVLSAVEGLDVATPALKPYVIPITMLVLIGLFLFQRRGTATIGLLFGPVMVLWFVTLALLGIAQIASEPAVLKAIWPGYAMEFAAANPGLVLFTLGAVFLVLTGAEALYADMGHFGRKPIRIAWFGLVLPALLLNYFGQGALVLHDPAAIENPFYLMAPEWGLYPLVVLATAATVIASQAVISGAFSLTQQAMQLGYLPKLTVLHTSSTHIGQIYLPAINWMLLVLVTALVLGFKSSSNLAAAYGFAVSGTMVITTAFAILVARHQWKWTALKTTAIFGVLLAIDLFFFVANGVKILEGAWFPLLFASIVFAFVMSWKHGRERLDRKLDAEALPLMNFIGAIEREPLPSVSRTAVFMTPRGDAVPHALLHNLKHNRVLHQRVVIATVSVLPLPRVNTSKRSVVERLNSRFWRVTINYGFMERPDVPSALQSCAGQGLRIDPDQTSYFLCREMACTTSASKITRGCSRLVEFISRNSGSAANYFRLPANSVVELGSQVIV